jgi:hypothetical protein
MSAGYQAAEPFSSGAFKNLEQFVSEQLESPVAGGGEFEQFERELRERVMAFEAEVVGARLQRYDVDEEQIEVFGERFRRRHQFEKEYHGLAGSVTVKRTLYVPSKGKGRAIVPLELRAGIVEGAWSPLLARVMSRTVASTTPKEAAELFEEFGGAKPSTSSLDRLPKSMSEIWESQREFFEDEIRTQESVPDNAVAVGASLDGVLIPMKKEVEAEGEKGDSDEAETPKNGRGPHDYREASCGTISFFDSEGERIGTVRYARAPEYKKRTLKSQLEAELESIFAVRPDLKLVTLSDAAPDNWEFLSGLPERLGVEISREAADLFHVLERVKKGLDAYHGEGTTAARTAFEECRIWLREEEDGPERVLRALRYRRDKCRGAKRKKINTQIKYIENRKREGRLCYKQLLDENLPVGSGVVEAACKTLASERLKRSGMSWGAEGPQGILTFRSLIQSNRWAPGWKILSAQYRTEVKVVQRGHRKSKAA